MDKTYSFTVHEGEDYISIDNAKTGQYKEITNKPLAKLIVGQLKAIEKYLALEN